MKFCRERSRNRQTAGWVRAGWSVHSSQGRVDTATEGLRQVPPRQLSGKPKRRKTSGSCTKQSPTGRPHRNPSKSQKRRHPTQTPSAVRTTSGCARRRAAAGFLRQAGSAAQPLLFPGRAGGSTTAAARPSRERRSVRAGRGRAHLAPAAPARPAPPSPPARPGGSDETTPETRGGPAEGPSPVRGGRATEAGPAAISADGRAGRQGPGSCQSARQCTWTLFLCTVRCPNPN